MRKFRVIYVLFLIFFLNNPAVAKVESWYLTVGAGYSFGFDYDNSIVDAEIDSTNAARGDSDHLSYAFDVGAHFPILKTTLLGGAGHGVAREYGDESDANYYSIGSTLISVSVIHFFGAEIGRGFFIRLDPGVGFTHAERKEDGNYSGEHDMKWSIGFTSGVGYAIPISEGTRIALSFNYHFMSGGVFQPIENYSVKIGFMF